MKAVDLLRIRKQLSRLLRRAACETTVIASAGESDARLVSSAWKERRRPGVATGRLTEAFFEPLPADELAAWEQ